MFAANTRVKNIQLHEALGSGAFGTVFRATDLLLTRECAIKFVPNTNPTGFVAHLEGAVLQKCKHDNVVEVLGCDVYADGATLYAGIEMQYMADGSAEAAVRSRFLSVRTVAKIGIDILFALEHTHNQGILHRDIKPANIMLTGSKAKLSDFGLAAAMSAIGGVASGKGSPVYCAPEVFKNNSTTVQTEVFSVGMSLFQLFNNYSTDDFEKKINDVAVIHKGNTIKTMGYRSYVPRRVRLICNKACAFNPSDRYKSAHELRQALESLKVAIDWKWVADLIWEGEDTSKKSVAMRHERKRVGHENVWTVNGRRVNAQCSFHLTEDGCRQAQTSLVYSTTL